MQYFLVAMDHIPFVSVSVVCGTPAPKKDAARVIFHITGFGKFFGVVENPSTILISQLPAQLPQKLAVNNPLIFIEFSNVISISLLLVIRMCLDQIQYWKYRALAPQWNFMSLYIVIMLCRQICFLFFSFFFFLLFFSTHFSITAVFAFSGQRKARRWCFCISV